MRSRVGRLAEMRPPSRRAIADWENLGTIRRLHLDMDTFIRDVGRCRFAASHPPTPWRLALYDCSAGFGGLGGPDPSDALPPSWRPHSHVTAPPVMRW